MTIMSSRSVCVHSEQLKKKKKPSQYLGPLETLCYGRVKVANGINIATEVTSK
jgi:hypothetical protein